MIISFYDLFAKASSLFRSSGPAFRCNLFVLKERTKRIYTAIGARHPTPNMSRFNPKSIFWNVAPLLCGYIWLSKFKVMKKITLLFCLIAFKLSSQCTAITLVSASDSYFSCAETLQPITPIVFQITDPNYTLTNFAPGITATFDGTLLTLSGTLPYPGYWSYTLRIPNNPDCIVHGGIGGGIAREISLQCIETTSNSITVSLPPENAVNDDGVMYLQCSYNENSEVITYFLPAETTHTFTDLPPDTQVVINCIMENTLPYCFPVPIASIVCTTAALDTNTFDGVSIGFSPNPVKDFLELSSKTTIDSVAFYDLLGREVHRQNIASSSKRINLSQLKQGTYLMRIDSAAGTATYKIIKQ